MLALMPPPSLSDLAAPSALHAAPFALPPRAPAAENPGPHVAPAAKRAALLARRRLVLVARANALRMTPRRVLPEQSVDLLAPLPRQSARQIEAAPLLSPLERRRVRLEVEIARDGELWAIGRAAPCYWLALSVPANLDA